ncbi:hypothetical protein ACKWTF_015373 [Chironomus riparius]
MKCFVLIFILNLILNVNYSESGSPGYIPQMELPPSSGMRVLEAQKPDQDNVKSVFEALVVGDIDQVIEKAEEIKKHVENDKEAKSSFEKVVNDIFENKDASC